MENEAKQVSGVTETPHKQQLSNNSSNPDTTKNSNKNDLDSNDNDNSSNNDISNVSNQIHALNIQINVCFCYLISNHSLLSFVIFLPFFFEIE